MIKEGGIACLIGPVHPTFWLSRFFADVWMLFPTEAEYQEVRLLGLQLPASDLTCFDAGRHHHRYSGIYSISCALLLLRAVVHQGGLRRCEDQADRPQVVPRRAAARPHHGLLRHWRQAQGEALLSAALACMRLAGELPTARSGK